jgi:hypothetical protein
MPAAHAQFQKAVPFRPEYFLDDIAKEGSLVAILFRRADDRP